MIVECDVDQREADAREPQTERERMIRELEQFLSVRLTWPHAGRPAVAPAVRSRGSVGIYSCPESEERRPC